MSSLMLKEVGIRAGATEKSLARGLELFRRGAVSHTAIQGDALSGVCEDTETPFYKVRAELDGGGIRSACCTCLYEFGGYCKHIVALLLSYARGPEQFAMRKDPAELLSDFLDAGEGEAALRILLTLLEESHDGFEYVDDSNGELGDFLSGLGGTLAEVILSLDLHQEQL